MSTTRAKIRVRGVVQGVGFRPFVFRLAARHGLHGWVYNAAGDVRIDVEGPAETLGLFLSDLKTQAPRLARIDEISSEDAPLKMHRGFQILESDAERGNAQPVSADVGTCPRCLEELFDPSDRRYRYPFTNCTDCGPRFTIILEMPYDRPSTTMREFNMCAACRTEYENPVDRRFHAQPNACPVCGPTLMLADNQGRLMDSSDPVADAAGLLRQGRILAMKGLGGFLLACDATSDDAVGLLRKRKKRTAKPFALMMKDLETIRGCCDVSPEEAACLLSPASPIVLLRRRQGAAVSTLVAPGLMELGVMLPYTPLHHLLLRESGVPLVMTSGNWSEEPIIKDNDEALERLAPLADFFLLHDRDIHARCDDSVVRAREAGVQVLRRARGYAPHPVRLSFQGPSVLACGAELKSTFCITRDDYAFLSPHVGDLVNLESTRHFEHMVEHYTRLFRAEPRMIAHDMHPDYLSTRFALRAEATNPEWVRRPVQHHHAHVVSCMADNGVEEPVLGVAFDGTGYGTDGNVWGGEFLRVSRDGFVRMGHLEYVPMPGGDAAIRKPFRMALGALHHLFPGCLPHEAIARFERIGKMENELIQKQVERGINAPWTSSMGRLFDAVAALLGLRDEVDYEAQAAMELEGLIRDDSYAWPGTVAYPMHISDEGDLPVVRLGGLFEAILADLSRGLHPSEVSARFHHTVADMALRMCRLLQGDTGIRKVVLSGGVFQNRRLQGMTTRMLREGGFDVYTHRRIPCNDGGVSLGQAVAAAWSVMSRG